MYRILPDQELILASSSPRRRELLAGCGLMPAIVPPDCDETQLEGEEPSAMVERLAALKAETIAKLHPTAWVIGADTTVVLDGAVLGKPTDRDDAAQMLLRLQGRTHEVWGGVVLTRRDRKLTDWMKFKSVVRMRTLDPRMIAAYVGSSEPMDKAGSYAIQGIGASLIEEVQGSYTNVVGLNLFALIDLLMSRNIVGVAAVDGPIAGEAGDPRR